MDDEALLLTNARVLTCDARGTTSDSVLIRDGRVAALGDDARAAGAGVRRLDLDGTVVLPGLIDTHPHLMHFGVLTEPLADLLDARDHDDIRERIAAKAREIPPGEWVMATPVGEPHYFQRRSWRDLAEGELPDRTVLDAATREHPVLLQAWAPVTPNICVLNTLGLERFGLLPDPPERFGTVTVERDAAGQPTGRLHGSVNNYYSGDPEWEAKLHDLPLFQPDAIGPGTTRAMGEYNALGVTTVYEGHAMDFPLIEAWRWLRSEDALTVRVLCCPEAEPYGQVVDRPLSDDEFDERLERAAALVERNDDLFRVDGVTIGRGGPCWPGFLLMREPYTGPYGEPTTGRSFVSRERARRAIDFCKHRGLRLNVVTAGTAEHDEYLDDFEEAGAGEDWIIQHAYFVEPEQARRFAAAGVELTTSLSFAWGKRELFRERIGEAVLDHLIPLRRLLDAGIVLGCGSDWGPKNIFEQIALAVERPGSEAAQAVTREEALVAWTRDAARVLRWEGIGTIEPGQHADVVVVDRDPLTAPVEELPGTRVLRTLLGGATVYEAGTNATAGAD
jgi:predicted amidohydrolase YtcJ